MTTYSLDVLLSWFGASLLSHVQFELLLLDLHPDFSRGSSGGLVFPILKNFPQFVVIHTVKGFGVINKADIFRKLSCFFDDPTDVSNLISASSTFYKSSLNIWKFSVHTVLKPSLENLEHYFASMWNECNCAAIRTFLALPFFGTGMKNDFSSPGATVEFPYLLAYWMQYFYSIVF